MKFIDWIASCLVLGGLWPLADPGHDGSGGLFLTSLDIAAHAVGMIILLVRWKIVRRIAAPITSDPVSGNDRFVVSYTFDRTDLRAWRILDTSNDRCVVAQLTGGEGERLIPAACARMNERWRTPDA
jgi:hypothetical protein